MKNKSVVGKIPICILILIGILMMSVSAMGDNPYIVSRFNERLLKYHITSQIQLKNQVKGGEGAQLVYTMAISPHNTDIMLLGNNTSGVYRSSDGGKNWSTSSEGINSPCIDTVMFDPDDADISYAAVATGSNAAQRGNSARHIGLYKSTDGGRTWSNKLVLSNIQRVSTLLAFGRKDEQGRRPLFTAASDATDCNTYPEMTGLWRSYDKGETWESLGLKDRSVYDIYADTKKDLLIIASDKGLDVSYDNGTTFTSLADRLPYTASSQITVNPDNENHWIVGSMVNSDTGNSGGMLYESFDAGSSWSEVNGVLYGKYKGTYISSLDFIRVNGHTNPRLLMSVYRLNSPNRYSDDMGKTFEIPQFKVEETYGLYKKYDGYFSLPYCINPLDNNIVFTSLIAPYKSTDGGSTYEYSGSGYTGFMVNDFHFDENGAIDLMAITDVGFSRMKPEKGSVFSSSYGISSIIKPSSDFLTTSTSIAVDPLNNNHGFATMGGYIYREKTTLLETRDGFNTLEPIQSFEEKNTDPLKYTSKVMYHRDNPNIVYTDYFVSENNGKTWMESAHPICGVSINNPDRLYSLDNYNFYVSDNRGLTWQNTGLSINNQGKYQALCIDNFYEDVIWTADHSVLYRVDIAHSRVDKFTGGKTPFRGRTGNKIEFLSILQNPRLKGHFILTGRDLNAGGSYVYESFDYCENFRVLECFPYLAYENAVKFHPTENICLFSGMMGTFAYEWDKGDWNSKGGIKSKNYDKTKGTYVFKGYTSSDYILSPVSLLMKSDKGEEKIYFTNTDEKGNFEFFIEGIQRNSGIYSVSVNLIERENYLADKFDSNDEPIENLQIRYHVPSANIVISGSAEPDATISYMLIENNCKEVTNSNVLNCVKYVGEVISDKNGDFVSKFRFDVPSGKSVSDYSFNISRSGFVKRNIPIKMFENSDYGYFINVKSGNQADAFDFSPGSEFSVELKWKYFMEDELKTRLVAGMYDVNGKLIKVYVSENEMIYNPENERLSGTIADKCEEFKVFLWSDMYPISDVIKYKNTAKETK